MEQPSLDRLLTPDSPVMRVAEAFGAAHKELYLVGGPVRDAWLKRPHGDLDFSTNARPDETRLLVEPLATGIWLQGAEYGTVGAQVDGVRMEITTFRTERYQPGSRHPEVEFATDVETDLSRRDFTINAMAVQLPDGQAIDPFGGVDDLKRRVIRTPMDPKISFTDDPLRMLRAFRFASQLRFSIAPEVIESITALKDLLRSVSAERIRDELSKLLIGDAPGRALELADSTGITDLFLPELSTLKLEQDPVHKHKDVFHHTLAVVERTEPRLELRLAALLHDIGKPRTRNIDEQGVSFHHHEVLGSRMAEERLRALRYPNQVVETVRDLIFLHHRFHTYRLGWTDSAVRRYVRDAGPLLGDLNMLVRADCTTRNPEKARRLMTRMDELEARIRELAESEELASIRPELDGTQIMAYLGVEPGPIVGRARDFMIELRLEEGELGADEAYKRLDAWARENGIVPVGKKVPSKPKKRDPEPE
jgi:poly(A) polymerase